MHWTPQIVAGLLRERGLRPKKGFGQNFLADDNFIEALVRDAEIGREDGVVEIGSGIGNVTDRLADRAGHVWAFEIDPDAYGLSVELLGKRPNVTLVHRDGAEFAQHIDPNLCARLKIVSNLPYFDWQRILLRLLSTPLAVVSYTLMLQADVVDRLRARPGTKGYGPMPVLVQGGCEMRKLRRAGRRLFYPAPRVESEVIQIRRKDATLDFVSLEVRLRRLFAHRRKKSSEAGGRRVESLTPEELLSLCLSR